MRKYMNPLKRINKSLKNKARNSANQLAYMAMWGEEPPKRYRKIKTWR